MERINCKLGEGMMAKGWRYSGSREVMFTLRKMLRSYTLLGWYVPKSVAKVKTGIVKMTLKNPSKNSTLEISKFNTADFSSGVRTKQRFFG